MARDQELYAHTMIRGARLMKWNKGCTAVPHRLWGRFENWRGMEPSAKKKYNFYAILYKCSIGIFKHIFRVNSILLKFMRPSHTVLSKQSSPYVNVPMTDLDKPRQQLNILFRSIYSYKSML